MHEVGIVREILKVVSENVVKAGAEKKKKKVMLSVTNSGHVSADSIKMLFETLVVEYPALVNTTLEIDEKKLICKCASCGKDFEQDDIIPVCPHCGEIDAEMPEHVHDIDLVAIEIDD